MSRPRRPRLRRSLSELSAMLCSSWSTNLRDDHGLVDHAGLGDVGDPAVDDDRGVEHQGPRSLDLLGELDVGDDEAEIVLGLEQRGDADVAHEDHEDARDSHVDLVVQVELHRRLDRVVDEVAQEDADDHPEVEGGDRLDALPRREQVAGDHSDGGDHHADEDDVRIGKLILADDPR